MAKKGQAGKVAHHRKNRVTFDGIMQNVSSYYVFLYLFLMAAVFPFFLTRGYYNAGTDKSMLFRYIGEGLLISVLPCALLFWLDHLGREGIPKFFSHLSDTDWLILGYLLINLISYWLSDNQEEAFWGAKGWYIGLMTQLIYIASYFFISRFLRGEKVLLALFGVVSTLLFVLGILNRFSIYPIKLDGANAGFISTLGNINWFCGYWSVLFPIAVGVFYRSKGKRVIHRLLAGLYLAVAAATGAIQGSDSALLVFVGVTLVLFCLSTDAKRRQGFYEALMVIFASCQGIHLWRMCTPERFNFESVAADLLTGSMLTLVLFGVSFLLWILYYLLDRKQVALTRFLHAQKWIVLAGFSLALVTFVALIIKNTNAPGSIGVLSGISIFSFGPRWGSLRGVTWTAGLRVFQDQSLLKRLIGIGPDSFAYGVYREGSNAIEMVTDAFGSSRLTNAHNEWITVLVNTGIFGLLCYVGFFVGKAVRFLKDEKVQTMTFACGLALVGYMCNNIFSFQQVLNGPFVYIAMGIGEAFLLRSQRSDIPGGIPDKAQK